MARHELPAALPYDFLKEITNDFAEDRKISETMYATLYKGIIRDDGRVIAVKKLQDNGPITAEKAFINEVENFSTLKHANLVEMVGYCGETHKKLVKIGNRYIQAHVRLNLLCYEYLSMQSLQENLFGKKEAECASPDKPNVHWDTRFKIIKGICLGLLFLHKLDIPIIHMDLKPENILLDSKMVPKIVHYALSTVYGHEETRLYTQTVAGSYAYMAPEYLYRGEISTKTDIYSLGVLIIEITTGEKNCPENNQPSARTFIEKVQNIWRPDYILSNCDLDSCGIRQVIRCIEIGLRCVNTDRKLRPSIENIIDMLNAIS